MAASTFHSLLLGRAVRAACAALLAWGAAAAQAAPPEPRLYVLDCGHAEFKDFSAASDTGDYDGRAHELADPCFLVRHPKGWLLWDAGLPLVLPASVTGGAAADVFERLGFRTRVDVPLEAQLAQLGLKPSDVGLVAFSHLHFDHIGQAGLFTRATWLLQRPELAWARRRPPPVSMAPELLQVLDRVQQQVIDGDHDVFGDGSVRILQMPGHTPGSSVLLVQLPRSGPVLLSGDLYLSLEGRQHRHVPRVNADRADTLASMDRLETLARRLGARVIVQHDAQEFSRLPRPPAYLD